MARFELMEHQKAAVEFIRGQPRVFDMSDTGTGKTLTHLAAWYERRKKGGGKLLVLAPKTILYPAWGQDLEKFFPDVRYSIAFAKNREKAFLQDADVYITNIDAVNSYLKHKGADFFEDMDTLIVDESTALKHPTSNRSKAARKVAKFFDYRNCLTGTPYNVSVTELWHQVLILDDGERLGQNFYKFRNSVQTPVQKRVGPQTFTTWTDNEHAEAAVASLLMDMTIRNVFEECVDIPPQTIREVYFNLSPKHWKRYERLREEARLVMEDGETITAVHAGALAQKLLQCASGAVYSDEGDGAYKRIACERYELIAELVAERAHPCIVFFHWQHQREELKKALRSREIVHAYIDGSVSASRRGNLVDAFQNGDLDCLLLQPMAAAHGLTLTEGKTVIWASPERDPGLNKQGNARIYRTGQTDATEVLRVCAMDTVESKVYNTFMERKQSLDTLLELFS